MGKAPVPAAATASKSPDPVSAIVAALNLLNRASSDWRNGGGCDSGALHWPVAVSLARRQLREALEALAPHPIPMRSTAELADALAGMAWFNSLTASERRHWLEVAGSAVPADAWRAFKTGEQPSCENVRSGDCSGWSGGLSSRTE